ncbi:hypothetical protein CYMTET_40461 [Cymbomonas tetramitiformis]|uniref:Uncharacterized protein n=1 Tax=Cymbomonas tetramitiformis TaxID=36881 RepID=A0AAE0CA96_9CHLO|nr:hypothetical protein CYMTET_40461 [Cymbomonas tetramitiformis]
MVTTPAVFLASVRTLTRDRFDEVVAKHVVRKIFADKKDRFRGDEAHVGVLFAKLVPALREIFVHEDPLFSPFFGLEDVTLRVHSDANRLLFSTLELIFAPGFPASDWLDASAEAHPFDGKRVLLEVARRLLDSGGPFAGTQELLGVRIPANVDPGASISGFNYALSAARRKCTFDDEEVRGLFIKALDDTWYLPVKSRLLLHDQRAAVDLATIQQWVRECHAQNVLSGKAAGFANAALPCDFSQHSALHYISTIVLELKAQVKALSAKIDAKGYTPRAQKPDPRQKHFRFAAKPLDKTASYSQSLSKDVAFHQESATFVPKCKHSICLQSNAKHWYRDCPHGGPRAEQMGAHSFVTNEIDSNILAAQFQQALDNNDSERFDALCVLARGRPDTFNDVSAHSFKIAEEIPATIDADTAFCQTADATLGGFSVGGVLEHTATFGTASVPQQAVPTAVDSTCCDEHSSDEEDLLAMRPVAIGPPPPPLENALFCEQIGEAFTFADRVARDMGHESHFHHLREQAYEHEDSASDESSDDETSEPPPPPSVVLEPPRRAVGPPRVRHAFVASLMATFFCLCATAAPTTGQAVGGVFTHTPAVPEPLIGGVVCSPQLGTTLSSTLTSTTTLDLTSPPDPSPLRPPAPPDTVYPAELTLLRARPRPPYPPLAFLIDISG